MAPVSGASPALHRGAAWQLYLAGFGIPGWPATAYARKFSGRATYFVYFQDDFRGAVALHNFAEMLRLTWGQPPHLRIVEQEISLKHPAVLELLRQSAGASARTPIFSPSGHDEMSATDSDHPLPTDCARCPLRLPLPDEISDAAVAQLVETLYLFATATGSHTDGKWPVVTSARSE